MNLQTLLNGGWRREAKPAADYRCHPDRRRRHNTIKMLAVATVFFLACCTRSFGFFIEQGGLVVMDADHYQNITAGSAHFWVETNAPAGFASPTAMYAAPNTGVLFSSVTNAPEMTYPIQLTDSGTFTIWLRGFGPSATDDSVYVGVDNQKPQALPFSSNGAWVWSSVSVTITNTGLHQVNVWMREDGSYVDRLLLSSSATYIPTGGGPAETGFSVQITSPAQGTSFTAGSSIPVSAGVIAASGPGLTVRFYANGTLTATVTNAPYNFMWTPLVGGYQLSATAVTSTGYSITSAPVSVTIAAFNVQITTPIQSSVFYTGTTIPVSAGVSNVTGPVVVNFYVNGALAIADTNAPYTYKWTPNAPGNYMLSAAGTDSRGDTASSSIISVTITSRPPATLRYSTSTDTIYVGGGGVATLTDIAIALRHAPLLQVDPLNRVWYLGASIVVQEGAILQLHGSAIGGDVNELHLQSDHAAGANYVHLDADWGMLDLQNLKVISWNDAINGPDIQPAAVPRAFVRARSRVGTNMVQQSTLNVVNAEIGWLGFGNSEGYGLTWEVVGNTPGVSVFGTVSNSYIHNCELGAGTWSGTDVSWMNNEISSNLLYGLNTNDAGVQAVLAGNHVHDNTLGATFSWASSNQRIYVGGPGTATLSDIKTAIPNAPVCLIDPTNLVWFLGATLEVTNGATLLVHGAAQGGDVNELRLKSDAANDTNSYVWVDADWGILDFNGVKVVSWNELNAAHDTDYTSFARAFIRARSRLAGANIQQSTLNVANSEIGWLGINASDSFALTWQVVGSAPGVTGFGAISNNYIHDCQMGVADWFNNPKVYGSTVQWANNNITGDTLFGFDPTDPAQQIVMAHNRVSNNSYGPFFRWANVDQRIYVTGNGDATLTSIKNALPTAPLTLVDPTNHIWYLTANLWVNNGAHLKLYGPSIGGDVGTLRIQSNHALGSNGIVQLRADPGWLDIQNTKITSWNPAVNGPDIINNIYTQPRSFVHARSTLDPDGHTAHEARMDIINSDIGYLGYHATEAYGLTWKVVDTTAKFIPAGSPNNLYDLVKVYGNIENSHLHNNCFGMYSYGEYGGIWINNEVDHNLAYGFDPHNRSVNLDVENNNIHDNGWHGFIASVWCFNGILRNNQSYRNGQDLSQGRANGIMLHRSCNNWLISGNLSYSNRDSGIAIFAANGNLISNNICTGNGFSGIRLSVGARNNLIVGNQLIHSAGNGLYCFTGTNQVYSAYVNETIHTGQYYVTVGTNRFVADEPTTRCQFNIFTNNFINGTGLNISNLANIFASGLTSSNVSAEPIKVDQGDSNVFAANLIIETNRTFVGGILLTNYPVHLEGTNNIFISNTMPDGTGVQMVGGFTTPSWTFAAASGTISAPFTVNNGLVSQSVLTGVTNGGQAVYTFTSSVSGNYTISADVIAPSLTNNSFYVNIDSQPTDPLMGWDIPVSTVLTSQTVSWRGTGSGDPATDQFTPKVFTISSGKHTLIIRGREPFSMLGTIRIAPYGTNNVFMRNTLPAITAVRLASSLAIPSQTFAATSGTISPPFTVNNGLVSQSVLTGVNGSGQAVYSFNISVSGTYTVSAEVIAPSLTQNSFYVNFDSQPTDPLMVWDIPVSPVLTTQTVSWRGNGSGTPLAAQFLPKVFNLSAGKHTLIIRGREPNTTLGAISIISYGTNFPNGPYDSSTATFANQPRLVLELDTNCAGIFTDNGGAIFVLTNSPFASTNVTTLPTVTNIVASTGSTATVKGGITINGIKAKILYLHDFTVLTRKFNALPGSGTAQIVVTTWNLFSPFNKAWTVKGSSSSMSINYRVGDLRPGTTYTVQRGSGTITRVTANSQGYISFTSNPGTTSLVSYTVF
jgi:parallel beta-helix repeat protein